MPLIESSAVVVKDDLVGTATLQGEVGYGGLGGNSQPAGPVTGALELLGYHISHESQVERSGASFAAPDSMDLQPFMDNGDFTADRTIFFVQAPSAAWSVTSFTDPSGLFTLTRLGDWGLRIEILGSFPSADTNGIIIEIEHGMDPPISYNFSWDKTPLA